jgi:hypothetical protein
MLNQATLLLVSSADTTHNHTSSTHE